MVSDHQWQPQHWKAWARCPVSTSYLAIPAVLCRRLTKLVNGTAPTNMHANGKESRGSALSENDDSEDNDEHEPGPDAGATASNVPFTRFCKNSNTEQRRRRGRRSESLRRRRVPARPRRPLPASPSPPSSLTASTLRVRSANIGMRIASVLQVKKSATSIE